MDKHLDSKFQLILIDDNEIDQLLHRKIIELSGNNVSIKQYTDANQALKIISNPETETGNIITTILLDIKMPIMDGFQFLEKFQELPDTIKAKYQIYILSSSLNQFDISRAKSNDYVKDMIIKPLTSATFLNILTK